MEEIRLRPAWSEDFAFLFSVRRRTMKSYVEQTWGQWEDTDQQERFRRVFDPTTYRVIVFDGKEIGCLTVEEPGDCLFLAFIAIDPEYQRRGLGSRLVQLVIAKAERRGIPVRLNVLKVNPARSLYERLGFCVVGGDEFRHYMERAPSRPYP